jgi:hypothetical protein
MEWAFEDWSDEDETIDEVVGSTGALLVGKRTQDARTASSRASRGRLLRPGSSPCGTTHR